MSLSVRRRLMMGALDHPEDGKYCWVVSGSNADSHQAGRLLYFSNDYGASFTKATTSIPGVNSVAVDPTGSLIVIGGSGTGYYVRRPGEGSNITFTGGGWGKSVCCGANPTTRYSVFYGVNAGTDWSTGYSVKLYQQTNRPNNVPNNRATLSTWDKIGDDVGACSENGQYGLIGGAEGYTNAFYSNDRGVTWGECLATQSFGNGTRAVAVSGTGRTALTTTSTGWNRSYDYLATWTQGNAATTWWGVAISGNDGYGQGVAYLTNSNKGLWRGPISSTGTITWTKILDNANIKFLKTNFYGTRLLGISFTGAVYYSSNGGYTWTASTGIPAGGNILSIGMNRKE